MNLSKPREAALKALVKCEKDGAYLNIALREILEKSEDVRDNALATEISFGVMKNRLLIDNIIENISTVKLKKLSVWIHNILRIGIYSIKFLDRIPDSATVSECVKLSRRYGHGASAGFVNAVLRKAIDSPLFLPDEKNSVKYLSVLYSLPEWLVRMWIDEGYGESLFESMNKTPKTIVRLNQSKSGVLSDDFIKCNGAKYAYSFEGKGSVENTREYKEGLVTVQDEASQRAIELLGIFKGASVLDLCAAPGGKTTFVAQIIEGGSLISCDIHSHKLNLIEENLKRLGLSGKAKVLLNDAEVENESFLNSFDFVLADVPCSGLGIIRRRPDIKWAKSEEDIISLIPVQRKILKNASKYVKKGGKLLYSTCTISRCENEENVKNFLENHKDFKISASSAPYGIQFTPESGETDGFFAAVLERM